MSAIDSLLLLGELRKNLLEKRSKNVKEQTTNITPAQADARRQRYVRSLGLEPKRMAGDNTTMNVNNAGLKGNELRYGGQFTLAHELGHAMFTGKGKQGDKRKITDQYEDDVINTAIEHRIDRRAGVNPHKFDGPRGDRGTVNEAGEDFETGETIPMQWTHEDPDQLSNHRDRQEYASKIMAPFDAGAKFNAKGKLGHLANLDARINQRGAGQMVPPSKKGLGTKAPAQQEMPWGFRPAPATKSENADSGKDWRGRSILNADHARELDHAAAAHALRSGSAEEGERLAYQEYRRPHLLDAMAHHYRQAGEAQQRGDHEVAQRHLLSYGGHARELGFDPMGQPPPEVGERIRQLSGKRMGFRGHAADALQPALERSEPTLLSRIAQLRKDLAALRSGPKLDEDTHDYSHILKPEHRAAGYSLSVQRLPHFDEGEHHKRFDAILHHHGKEVGSASACTGCGSPSAMSIDTTTISGPHRGKGLGGSMYEAAMAHGRNVLGAKMLSGGVHSTSASRTHQSLSRKHGLSYKPQKIAENPEGEQDGNFGPYHYPLS